MLNDKVVLEYGIRKLLDLETNFLKKLELYDTVTKGNAKKLIQRLITTDKKHLSKLDELLKTLER